MQTTNKTIPHHVKKSLSDNWWEEFVLLCGNKLETQAGTGELVSTRNSLIEFRGVRFSSEWYGLVGASAQESLLLTQRTLLVSKVIFSAPNISTNSVLHTKQAINLNQVHSLSPRATGLLGVYIDWKKGYLISSFSCTAPVCLVVGLQVFCAGVWANQNFMSKPLKCSIHAFTTSPKIDQECVCPSPPPPPSAASAVDRCSVALMLWHFHNKMDAVGSERQQGDIYIRKNGSCQTRGGKEVQKQAQRSGYHITAPSSPPLDSHLARHGTGKGHENINNNIIKEQLCSNCRSSQRRRWGERTC